MTSRHILGAMPVDQTYWPDGTPRREPIPDHPGWSADPASDLFDIERERMREELPRTDDCGLGHGHTDLRAARACDLFYRAFDRYTRLDGKYRGSALWSNDRAFRVWMDAGRLVNSLFGIAMSDHPVMDR